MKHTRSMVICSDWEFYILLGSINFIGGLANIIQSPTNQTTCYGATATFTCVASTSNLIWTVNGIDPLILKLTYPAIIPQDSQWVSNLTFSSTTSFNGASIVCCDGQNNCLPAFLTILGSPSPPILISNPCNNRTCVNISWIFGSDNTSLLNYNIEIINKSGTMVYSQTLSRTQLIYTIPDPCDYYDAVVTAIYSHSNVSCLQNASMQQLVGASPLAPFISADMVFQCSLFSQYMLSTNISVPLQQGVCSYQISWTLSTSQVSSYPFQKPIISYQNQSILNIIVPINQRINLTVVASNSYGNSSYATSLSTYEIVDVSINTTSSPWTAECIFIPCSLSIGCLVYLNGNYCTGFMRYGMTVSCEDKYKNLQPVPGFYTVKAYTVYSDGSHSPYPVYNISKVEVNATLNTEVAKYDAGVIIGYVFDAAVVVVIILAFIILLVFTRIYMISRWKSHNVPDGNTHLHLAAAGGYTDAITELLSKDGIDFNAKNNDGNTPLHLAAAGGYTDVIAKLLSKDGIDCNAKNNDGNTPLHLAAAGGYNNVIVKLISKDGIDCNAKNKEGNLAYHVAVMSHHFACIKVFKSICIEKGKDGNTILHYAADTGWYDGVEYILKDDTVALILNLKNNKGDTALHLSIAKGHRFSAIQLLSHTTIDVNVVNDLTYTPLIAAVQYGSLHIVQQLITCKADVTATDKGGNTALHYAAIRGDVEVVKCLLKATSIHLNIVNNFKHTALYEAAKYGHTDCAMYLIEKGADVNICSVSGRTPLYRAVVSCHIEVVKLLLDVPTVDVNFPNIDGTTPLTIANINGWVKIQQLISEKLSAVETVQNSPAVCTDAGFSNDIHECAKKSNLQQLKQLVSLNPSIVNKKDPDDKTPLHHASYYGFITCLSFLMDVPDIDANCQDKNGSTPLHLAARSGIAVCVQKLLLHKEIKEKMKPDNDGNFAYHVAAMHCGLACLKEFKSVFSNKKGKDDNTILHYAAEIGWLDGVRYILNEADAKSIMDCQNKMGDTALHLAAARGHESVVKELLCHTEKVNLLNNFTYTPLIVAAIYGSLHIVEELLAKKAIATAETDLGNTALQYAAVGGHCTVVACLLSHIEPNIKNKLNCTALHYAAAHGYEDVVKCLLSKPSINLTIINIDGKTAKALAEEGKHTTIVTILDNHIKQKQHSVVTTGQETPV